MSDYINRQAAIKHLRKRLIETANNNVGFRCDAGETFQDASERVSFWVNELPSADAVEIVQKGKPMVDIKEYLAQTRTVLLTQEAFDELVKKTSAERHGKWIDGKRMGYDGVFVWHRECSECGYERKDDNIDNDTPYCPNCGARMEGE